jgi:dTDP-glucose 4,6-dehydratase
MGGKNGMRVLITGGAGFIGSNFVKHALREHSDWDITNLDKLAYAGNLENLADIEKEKRYHFVKGDISDGKLVDSLFSQGFDIVVNFAAESHVDRSIMDPSPFIKTNVEGTNVLLDISRRRGVERFLQVSTDEVYGSLGPKGKSREQSPLAPNSPYSASKAAADMMCRAYYATYNLPVIVTRCSNNYGPYQFPEKLIPLVVTNALENKKVPVYGDGLNIRDWIYVEDHCCALDCVIQYGMLGEIYNIGAHKEKANLELVKSLLDILGKPHSLITFVADRPGHDRRYALSAAKIRRELGWKPKVSINEGLRKTVQWYIDNEAWWRRIKSGEYAEYYKRMYSLR